MKPLVAMVLATIPLSGCSLFVPFHQDFSCTADRNYGKCTNVDGAYSEALGGTIEDPHYVGEDDVAKNQKKKHKKGEHDEADNKPSEKSAAYYRYKDAEYDELAKLIETPITPVVKQPEVLRTLVVAYATGEDKTLYMPRYIFYFASEAGFVLGDYLSAEKPLTPPTLYPQGTADR